jgi:Tfp pilus tip-associated adhesin PilY1
MKPSPSAVTVRCLLALLMAAGTTLAIPALAAPVALAPSPLATTTSTPVPPNIMFMLDDSGSMDWDYLPDTVLNFRGDYGFNSSQCNGTAYNPAIPYKPPVHSDGTPYPDSSFTNAPQDGYDLSQGYTDLSTSFPGGSGSGSSGSTLANNPQPAFYYVYKGSQKANWQQNYSNTSGTFYKECQSSFGTTPGTSAGSSPGNAVFTYVKVSTTSGTGGTDETTNFANWYSYYSNRMLMMKTGVGLAFISADSSYRIGFMTMNNNVPPDFVDILPFAGGCAVGSGLCQKDLWYSKLYTASPGSSTPLRQTLSQIGWLYAAKFAPTTTYTAKITVSGSTTSSTSVTSIVEGPSSCTGSSTSISVTPTSPCYQMMNAPSNTGSSKTYSIAKQIAGQINAVNSPNFSATYSGSTVTITGTSADLGDLPVVTSTGGGTFTVTSFVAHTTAGTLNGTTPLDPVQYSCQKNFVILSTDGYWNGNAGYKLDGTAIGDQDTAAPRPYYDGGSVNQVSTQVSETQTQVQQSTSQLLSDTQQYQVPGTITQQNTGKLYSWTGSYWKKVSSCKPSSSTCSIGTAGSPWWAPTTVTPNWVTVSSCTSSYNTGSGKWGTNSSGNATDCRTVSGWVNASAPCSPIGTSTCNLADTGWVPSASCTPGTSGGTTVQCQTLTTGPTYVASCTSAAANSSNNYTNTSCSTNTIFGPAYVAGCTPQSASSSNSWTNTVCTPTSTTTNNVSSCSAQTPSASNNYTTITCVAGSGGTSDTLADTAMYYYQTDLRDSSLNNCTGALGAGIDVCKNDVPASGIDNNPAQHLTTFTLGLGVRGQMVYSSTYLKDNPTSCASSSDPCDYFSVAAPNPPLPKLPGYVLADSSTSPPTCSWKSTGQICNWPIPANNSYTNVDDLWHAAVNGRGQYFSAKDPTTLSTGLSRTLSAISQVTGAAAAAATSTLNPVQGNNFAYVASYTTMEWIGNLEERTIDVNTGIVSTAASWCVEDIAPPNCNSPNTVVADASGSSTVFYCVVPGTVTSSASCTSPFVYDSTSSTCRVPINTTCSGTLPQMVSATSDTRTIYTANSSGTALIPFDSSFATANPSLFPVTGLSQWSTLPATMQANMTPTTLINYLRGQNGYEQLRTANSANNLVYRNRVAVMGDALESQPTFIAAPTFSYSDPGYSTFVTNNASRPGTVYIGTNDGMLHAFAASTGVERWAFVPSVVIPNMWKLADINYASEHVNFVNGSPVISDICTANCTNAATAVWKTILVDGLNAGGREFFALDITNPAAPSLLWEFTPTQDANLGYSYGRPVITKKQDGTWVVLLTSGYDNGTDSATPVTPATTPATYVPNSPSGDGAGHLYVINAATGSIISNISDTTGSPGTPSGLTKIAAYSAVLGTNQAGLVYGGDLLGNLWRFDINNISNAPFVLAQLEDPSGVAQPITTTPTLGAVNGVDIIFVGTGAYLQSSDLANTQVQTIYAITDNAATATLVNPAGSGRNSNTLIQQTLTNTGNQTRTDTNNAVDLTVSRGWYIDLPDTGERANVDFQLVQGTLLVPTIVPSNTACSPGGYSWLNYFNYKTGGPVDPSNPIVSQYYDSPIVGMNVLYINGQPMVETVTSNNPTPTAPPTQPKFQQGTGGFMQTRELWRELNP